MRYLIQGIMILIAVRTLFHCVLTGKITETISDGNYTEDCNHLQDKWSPTHTFIHIVLESCSPFSHIMVEWPAKRAVCYWSSGLDISVVVLASLSSDYIGKSNIICVASLQEHLGVPRALGILSLRAAPSHPVEEQRQPTCQSAVKKEWRTDWQLKES